MSDLDTLLNKLEDDLEPVKPLPSPTLRAVKWFFGGLFSILIVGIIVNFRMDLDEKIQDVTFISELVLLVLMSASAAYASAWLSLPDGASKSKTIILPYILIVIALALVGKEMISHGWTLKQFEFHHCIMDAMIMGTVPIGLMIFMMRQGAPTRPVLAIFTNMIAAGTIGYLGLRLTCGSDDISHVCVYHIMPFIVVGLVLGLLARRLYRW